MGDAMTTVLKHKPEDSRKGKTRCLEDVPPPSKPMTRVWLVFGTQNATEAIAAVKLLAWEGSRHPLVSEAKAGQPYIDIQFGQRGWRVHVDYADG